MWFDTESIHDSGHAVLASIGRALLVAQLFEDMVKRAVYVTDAITQVVDLDSHEAVERLEELLRQPEELFERLLARAIKRLETQYALPPDEVDTLSKAKDARNYLAHAAAMMNAFSDSGSEEEANALSEFQRHVHSLVYGYNLLSILAYEFEEREPAPPIHARRYPSDLEAWVLDPVTNA
jgi:hypothetical protein